MWTQWRIGRRACFSYTVSKTAALRKPVNGCQFCVSISFPPLSVSLIMEPLSCCLETLQDRGCLGHWPRWIELLVNYSLFPVHYLDLCGSNSQGFTSISQDVFFSERTLHVSFRVRSVSVPQNGLQIIAVLPYAGFQITYYDTILTVTEL